MRTRSVIIGASAGLGRALAERLAGIGHDLYLVASDVTDLEPLASDLRLRHGGAVHAQGQDITQADAETLAATVLERLGGVDNLFLVAGITEPVDSGPLPPATLTRLLEVNMLSAIRIVNAFLPHMATNPSANLVGAGSVAAGRARRNNTVYGTAKRGLEFYFEAMRHWLAADGRRCRVQFYRLGYLRTRMTFGQKLLFPALAPDQAAAAMVANLGRDLGVTYLPWWWSVIMAIIGLLPWPIFRRLNI